MRSRNSSSVSRIGPVRSSLYGGAALAFLFASSALGQTVSELPVHVPGSPTPALPLDVHRASTPAPALSVTDDGLGDFRGGKLDAALPKGIARKRRGNNGACAAAREKTFDLAVADHAIE